VTRERNGVYVWVTWLSKLMAGETTCQWSPWFKAHHTEYGKAPGDFQLAAWTAEHTRILDEVSKEREKQGETVYREGQNKFLAKRPSGLSVAGTPDLISMESQSGQCTVFDIKTGNPRQSDIIQVALYMMFLPYSTGLYKGKKMEGCVVYKTGHSEVPHQIIDDKFKKNVTYFLDILESSVPPSKLPSHTGCSWCDLTAADCPEKVVNESTIENEPGQHFPL
jgi:hypothetical protein